MNLTTLTSLLLLLTICRGDEAAPPTSARSWLDTCWSSLLTGHMEFW